MTQDGKSELKNYELAQGYFCFVALNQNVRFTQLRVSRILSSRKVESKLYRISK